MKYRRFTIGFLVALMLFAAANIYSYVRMPEYPSMDDGFVDFGWPLKVYARGGFWTHTVILWNGLVGDVLIALCGSLLVGFVLEARRQRRNVIALIVSAAEQPIEAACQEKTLLGSGRLGHPFKHQLDRGGFAFPTYASRTFQTDSQLRLGGASILTSRGFRNLRHGPGERNQRRWVSLPDPA